MLPLKYVIRTIAVSEDLNLLFLGDWYLIFGKLQYFNFRENELCHFREIERCHFREIEISHFREITVLRFLGDWNVLFWGDWNVSFLGDWNVSFSGDWNVSYLGNGNVPFSGDWNVLFSGDWNVSYLGDGNVPFSGDWNVSYLGDGNVPFSGDWNVSFSGDWNVSFQEFKILFKIKVKIQFSRDGNVHLEILLEFLFIKSLVFLKTILKAIPKTILIIIIIIIFLLIFFLPSSRSTPPPPLHFGFLFVIFYFCKSYNLDFFWIYFYALRRFLVNFQGYIASSRQNLFKTAWKQVPKKAKKSQNLLKSESDKKEHIKLPMFFFSKVSYYLGLKAWEVSS